MPASGDTESACPTGQTGSQGTAAAGSQHVEAACHSLQHQRAGQQAISSSSAPCTPARAGHSKPTSDVAGTSIPEEHERLALDSARDNALSDPGLPPHHHQQHASAAMFAGMEPTMPLPIGQRSSSGSIKEPGASVWLHEAYSNPHSSAASSPSPFQHTGTAFRGGGKLCASMEDMYNMIFNDAPSSNTAASPCPTGSMPTRQGSIASIGSCSSLPPQYSRSNHVPTESIGAAAGGVQVVGSSFPSNNGTYCQLDDLVPVGLAQLNIGGRRSGCSDTELGSAGFFLDDSPACSGSGSLAPEWPVSGVPAGSPVAAGPNRGSPRYGLHAAGGSSAPGAAPASQQQQQPRLKRLWDRRQHAVLLEGSSGSRSATSSPSRCIGGGVWRTHSSPAGPNNLTELAARLDSTGAATETPYGTNSSCSATPMSHSYSNPDIADGLLPPPCARSLFGSVPQMDRPLGSSSWLARADSGLVDEHLSAASGDEYIRQVNSENVLSSAWGPGPTHAKLLSFRYCDATSPLNHPGRASPFKGSPFASPRGSGR